MSNNTVIDDNNVDTIQTNSVAQSSVNNTSTNTSTDTGTTTGTSNRTLSDSEVVNNNSPDTGEDSGKRGVKVNGGEAGKLPDWMDGDY